MQIKTHSFCTLPPQTTQDFYSTSCITSIYLSEQASMKTNILFWTFAVLINKWSRRNDIGENKPSSTLVYVAPPQFDPWKAKKE